MRVLVSGSTGLIGSALITHLDAAGHESVRLVRTRGDHETEQIRWDPSAGRLDAAALDRVDAVVHLAGEGIASRRWSPAQKGRILDSRVIGTKLLADRIATANEPPRVFLCGSAIGFYGDRGDEVLTEKSSAGTGFLADVVQAWEGAASSATASSTRVAHLRTGIVLSADGGALAQQLPMFRVGLGGRVGNGDQWWSWISITDTVRAITWLLDNDVRGPVNLTAPGTVTQAGFASTLGRVLRRPTVLRTPKAALAARLGRELSHALLYTSQRVAPSVLTTNGFRFNHADLEPAFRAVLNRP